MFYGFTETRSGQETHVPHEFVSFVPDEVWVRSWVQHAATTCCKRGNIMRATFNMPCEGLPAQAGTRLDNCLPEKQSKATSFCGTPTAYKVILDLMSCRLRYIRGHDCQSQQVKIEM